MSLLTDPVPVPPADGHRGVLVWRAAGPVTVLSSASVGGGLGSPAWVLNMGVDNGYARTDLAVHVAEVAASLGLEGDGCALLTAAEVSQVQQAASGGVRAWATVGVTRPTWAVRPGGAGDRAGDGENDRAGDRTQGAPSPPDAPPPPGTVNIVVSLPVPLSTSALVQAVGTVTEAKTQALIEAGVPGTGTASDAVVVVCPRPDARRAPEGTRAALPPDAPRADEDPVSFAGVRSPWGQQVARAVHAAVAAGHAAHPWPPQDAEPDVVW